MGLTQKVIRRLGLGDAASRVLAPLAKDSAALPSPEEARAFLEGLRPGRNSSCLCRCGSAFGTAEDVDIELITCIFSSSFYILPE